MSLLPFAGLRFISPLLRLLRTLVRLFNAKVGRQWVKDYLVFPLLGLFAGAARCC